jgi:hypothetical protein
VRRLPQGGGDASSSFLNPARWIFKKTPYLGRYYPLQGEVPSSQTEAGTQNLHDHMEKDEVNIFRFLHVVDWHDQ